MKFYVAVTFITAACLAGCSTGRHRDAGTYSTVNDIRKRDSDRAEALNRQAVDLIDKNKLEEAEAKLREALTADVMCGPAHNNLGRVYFEQNKLYLAAWEFEYAVKLMPNQPEPRNNLGLVLETAQRLDDAVNYYREALKIEPDNAEILGNLVRARLRRGDRGEDLPQLLRELILKDTRPDWTLWAREQLVMQSDSTHGE